MDSKVMLAQGLSAMGYESPETMTEKFLKFRSMLLEWNEKINLTAITDDEGIIYKHFLDSITCLEAPIDFGGKRILDLGTGAGFPGIPMKIVRPDLKITLMDSLNKRVHYLKEVCKVLELDGVSCLHARAEEAARQKDMREQFDIVVSRAVANMSTLSEYCLPFVKVGGYFIAQKTEEAVEEIKAAQKAIRLLGGELLQIIPVQVPETDLKHNLVVIKKVKATPPAYPRKAGTPAKKPIS